MKVMVGNYGKCQRNFVVNRGGESKIGFTAQNTASKTDSFQNSHNLKSSSAKTIGFQGRIGNALAALGIITAPGCYSPAPVAQDLGTQVQSVTYNPHPKPVYAVFATSPLPSCEKQPDGYGTKKVVFKPLFNQVTNTRCNGDNPHGGMIIEDTGIADYGFNPSDKRPPCDVENYGRRYEKRVIAETAGNPVSYLKTSNCNGLIENAFVLRRPEMDAAKQAEMEAKALARTNAYCKEHPQTGLREFRSIITPTTLQNSSVACNGDKMQTPEYYRGYSYSDKVCEEGGSFKRIEAIETPGMLKTITTHCDTAKPPEVIINPVFTHGKETGALTRNSVVDDTAKYALNLARKLGKKVRI